MRILVLGAGGMAGHVITIALTEKGHEVFGLARRPLPYCQTIPADVTDTRLIKKNIQDGDYDAVINCIGVLNNAVDKNPYEGIWINACLPHLLVKLTEASPTRIIHLSTDCVFSGHDGGGHTEASPHTAETLYGSSKYLGEIKDEKNLTLRMSIIGPDINKQGIGLFNWFMREKDSVKGYTEAIWTGVTTPLLAEAIDAALAQELTGLYHLVNNETISKYSLLKLFNERRETPVDLIPSNAVKENKSLIFNSFPHLIVFSLNAARGKASVAF